MMIGIFINNCKIRYGVVILGTTYSQSWTTIFYTCILVYIVNYMTFGLVIAIIMDGFCNYLMSNE
jgi:hypothetical protein